MFKKVLKVGLYTIGFAVGTELFWRYICLWKRCEVAEPIVGKHFCKNEFCGIKNLERIAEIFDNAKSSIDIAMYMFYCQTFLLPLLKALDRGVSIRIIGSKSTVYKHDSIILRLASNGVPVRYHFRSPNLMHHKFCVVDANVSDDEEDNGDEKPISRVLFLGSQNWTEQSFYTNYEHFIITSNIKLIEKYSKEFNRLWDALDPESETNKLPEGGINLMHWK